MYIHLPIHMNSALLFSLMYVVVYIGGVLNTFVDECIGDDCVRVSAFRDQITVLLRYLLFFRFYLKE